MPKNRFQTIEELREWKKKISTINNIPMNEHYEYKDSNNIYERLTAYVKGFVENVFGKYTDAEGNLQSLGEEKNTWSKGLTDLKEDWWTVALKGAKEGSNPLPFLENVKPPVEDKIDPALKEMRDEVEEHLFSAYRTLKDSYNNRSIFEWFYNHKQYTAERDAMKVLENLITSIGGYSKDELKEHLRKHTVLYSKKDITETKVIPEAKPYVEKKLTSAEKLEQFRTEANVEMLVDKFAEAIENSTVDATKEKVSVFHHVDAPLRKLAQETCETYDIVMSNVEGGQIKETDKTVIDKLMVKATQDMFRTAFNALEATVKKTGAPVFGMKTLKDQIISAQKLADVALTQMTPVGFNKQKYGQYGKGYAVLESEKKVLEFLNAKSGGKYTAEEVQKAFAEAQKEFRILYRGELRELPQVYKIGYRPSKDRAVLKEEGKVLTDMQRLIAPDKQGNAQINNTAVSKVINENVRRWKVVYNNIKKGVPLNPAGEENLCRKMDKEFEEKFPNYNPESRDDMLKMPNDKKEPAINAPDVDLENNKNAQIVAPVVENVVVNSEAQINK